MNSASKSSNPLHDPYYLHPNESPGTVLINTTLTGSNYHLWVRAMTMVLKSKNKLKSIDGSIKKPSEEDPNFLAWDKINTMVLSWIWNSLNPKIHLSILWIEVAVDLWNDLHGRYYQGDLNRIANLQESLYALKQGDLFITKYFTRLKII